jgi:hypothetical protein
LCILCAPSLSSCFVRDCPGCGAGGPPTFFEHEPNDQASMANWIGGIEAHDKLEIRGSITHFGPDFFDGFAFVAEQPIDVQVTLIADDPSADLDFCVFDPILNDYVACFETPNQPETGLFSVLEAGREFHLVVDSFSGASSYSLFVEAFPVSLASHAQDGRAFSEPRSELEPTRHARFDGYRARDAGDETADALRGFQPGELIEIDERGNVHRTPCAIDERELRRRLR